MIVYQLFRRFGAIPRGLRISVYAGNLKIGALFTHAHIFEAFEAKDEQSPSLLLHIFVNVWGAKIVIMNDLEPARDFVSNWDIDSERNLPFLCLDFDIVTQWYALDDNIRIDHSHFCLSSARISRLGEIPNVVLSFR